MIPKMQIVEVCSGIKGHSFIFADASIEQDPNHEGVDYSLIIYINILPYLRYRLVNQIRGAKDRWI